MKYIQKETECSMDFGQSLCKPKNIYIKNLKLKY